MVLKQRSLQVPLVRLIVPDKPAKWHAGQMLDGMLGKSCHMLQSLGDFVDNPDVADDSFLLAGRALHYSPRLVVHEPLLSALLDSATAGLLVQHKCAC